MRKLLAVARTSARGRLRARGVVVGRAAFYALLLFVFARLWDAVGPGHADMVWYLAVTELLVLATPFLYADIETDVRRGDVAYALLRPMGYLWTKLGEGGGEGALRFVLFLPVGAGAAFLFAGGWPSDPRGLALAVPLAFLALLVMVVLQAGVGLCAVWLHEAAPIHWVVQKLVFVLGGLLFPLDVYPAWLRGFAEATPFAAIVYGPARLALAFDPALAAVTALRIVAWGAALLALVAWAHRAAVRRLETEGG